MEARAHAQPTTLDPAERLAAYDPYCPECAPKEESAAQSCDAHYEERWHELERAA